MSAGGMIRFRASACAAQTRVQDRDRAWPTGEERRRAASTDCRRRVTNGPVDRSDDAGRNPSLLTTGIAMSFLKSETLAPLWDDFDAREDLLRQIVADRLGEQPAAQRARPRGGDLLLRLPVGNAGACGRGDQLSRHQRDQEPAQGLAARAMLGAAGRRRCVRFVGPDRPVARRVSAQDDAAPRRARDLVRPAAHAGRRGHLRHVREPGRPPDLDPDPRRRDSRRSPARLMGRSTSARRRGSRSISRRSARS